MIKMRNVVTNGYKLYNPQSNNVIINHDMIFNKQIIRD